MIRRALLLSPAIFACSLASCLVAAPELCAPADPVCNPALTTLLTSKEVVDRQIDWLYFNDSGASTIYRVRPDGTDLSMVVTGTNIQVMRVDQYGGRLYWTEGTPAALVRSNLDGTNVQSISVTGTPQGLAVDGERGHLYVANSGTNQIERYDIFSSTATILTTGLTNPRDIDLDPESQALYWTDSTDGAVYSISTSGGPVSTIATGFSTPAGMLYEYNENAIYFTETVGSLRLFRLPVHDPGAMEVVHSLSLWVPVPDPERSRLFVSEVVSGTIYVTDWTGNIQYTLATPGGNPSSLFFLYK